MWVCCCSTLSGQIHHIIGVAPRGSNSCSLRWAIGTRLFNHKRSCNDGGLTRFGPHSSIYDFRFEESTHVHSLGLQLSKIKVNMDAAEAVIFAGGYVGDIFHLFALLSL